MKKKEANKTKQKNWQEKLFNTKWSNSSGSMLIAQGRNFLWLASHAKPTEVASIEITTPLWIERNLTGITTNSTLLTSTVSSQPSSILPICPEEPPDLQVHIILMNSVYLQYTTF